MLYGFHNSIGLGVVIFLLCKQFSSFLYYLLKSWYANERRNGRVTGKKLYSRFMMNSFILMLPLMTYLVFQMLQELGDDAAESPCFTETVDRKQSFS